jgi:hypothetical protein
VKVVEIGDDSFADLFRTHSGELVTEPFVTLSELPFVSTMALKALEITHSLAVFSLSLESRHSSP